LVHRSVEQIELTGKPVTTTLLTPAGSDADREQVVERYLEQAADAASGLPLTTVAVAPTFDLTGDERGIITRDRDLKDSARLFFGHDDAADAIGLAADR